MGTPSPSRNLDAIDLREAKARQRAFDQVRVLRMVRDGISDAAIARTTGISKTRVGYWRQAAGLPAGGGR